MKKRNVDVSKDQLSNRLARTLGGGGSLTIRSSSLVRRGLAALESLQGITPEMLGRICSDRADDNFEVLAAAAIKVSRLKGALTLEKEGAGLVLFSIVDNLHSFFERPA